MKALITGISGTLGQAVTEILLGYGGVQITGYSRDELKQSQLPHQKDMTLYIGDLRDKDRLMEASRGMDIIFHFGALKRVDTIEINPEEAHKTNIAGTNNVLHAQRLNGVPRVVLSSTDKAAYPINTYGCSKQSAEHAVLRNKNNVVCRYGNVLASRGSVVPVFIESILNDIPVHITDREMTRFFIKIEDAAGFVVCSAFEQAGGLKIPPMKACKIVDVANAIGIILNKPVTFKDVGLRPGEKIHECLRMEHEGGAIYSNTAPQFTQDELIQFLIPLVEAER